MPQGQWVAFEGEQPHKCDKQGSTNTRPSNAPQVGKPVEPSKTFTPFYPTPAETPTAKPAPVQSAPLQPQNPAPSPAPPVAFPRAQPPSPREAPKPASSGNLALSPPAPQSTRPRSRRTSVIGGLVGGLFGSAMGILFFAFGLLSLPLNVVAVMHLTGWPWFGALIGTIAFSCIPLIGQLGYFILAVMGGYYLWTANFEWSKAAYPTVKTFSVAALSTGDLERFKIDVLRPGLERACKSEALKVSGFDGKLPERVVGRCECLAEKSTAMLSREDLIAYEKSGQYPEGVQERIGEQVRRVCLN